MIMINISSTSIVFYFSANEKKRLSENEVRRKLRRQMPHKLKKTSHGVTL